jgi:hypothetical protein
MLAVDWCADSEGLWQGNDEAEGAFARAPIDVREFLWAD